MNNSAKISSCNLDAEQLCTDEQICTKATSDGDWVSFKTYQPFVIEAKKRGLVCGVGEQNTKSILSFYKDGLLVAGLSPKAILFFGTIFPTFINFGTNIISQFLILLITYVVLDFLTLMIYGLAAEKISVWLRSKPKLLNTISACVLLILAVYIAATQNF